MSERGTCPDCGRDTALTKDGKLRHHGGAQGTGDVGWRRAYRCSGTGKHPRQAARSEFFTCPGCGQSLKRRGDGLIGAHFDAAGYPCGREATLEPGDAPAVVARAAAREAADS